MEERRNGTKKMEKYESYKEQHDRLKKAMKHGFFFEAIVIEYAILEDRTESILRYEGNSINSKKHVTIEAKINKIETIAREKKGLAKRYFQPELIAAMREWKEKRNGLIHALMKHSVTQEELRTIALEGEALVKEVSRLSQNYKRAVERKNKSEV